ncbi:MAG TPA: hypothetical protein VIJ77_11065 [Candidatus Tumulicola sp.]
MKRALFVSNGHGEAAIADRIAVELNAIAPGLQLDHLALVGDGVSESLHDVGPARAMPSGGLIAMGNVRNIARDVRSGLLGLTLAQFRFLRGARGRYDAAAAIGDTYALLMASIARAPAVFVGTAKSVNVAPYGALEERLLRRAAACFVRDDATAERLRTHGISVEPAANVIVDLFATPDDPRAQRAVEGFAPAIALFPGSRAGAYEDAAFLLNVTRDVARRQPSLGAVLSIARGLDADRFVAAAEGEGWQATLDGDATIPFTLAIDGCERVRAWRGSLGPVLARVALVLGQAGTANEAAAAAGVPVVAFESRRGRKAMWYRRRQRGLLGEALAVFPATLEAAVAGVLALLNDPARCARMAATGRARMGPSGGARRIARRIAALAGVGGE